MDDALDEPRWYRDAALLRRLVDEHGSIRGVARATGAPRSTLQEWWERHQLPPHKPLPQPAGIKWGEGRPKPVRAATRDAWERVVFLSDLHFPYQDQAVCDAALELIRDYEPHRVVLNGDLNDMFALSRFNRAHEREDELQDEIDERNEYVALVRDAAPSAVIDETEGNHDSRIRTWLMANAKPLHTLRALQPASLFRHKEYGINWHPGCGFLLRPNFLVKHGTRISSIPGGTARAEATTNWISGASGHAHRAEQFSRTGAAGRIEWTVSGTLSRLDPDYHVGVPNWTQGLIAGEFSTRTEAFLVTQVPWMDDALRFGAARYGAVAA